MNIDRRHAAEARMLVAKAKLSAAARAAIAGNPAASMLAGEGLAAVAAARRELAALGDAEDTDRG